MFSYHTPVLIYTAKSKCDQNHPSSGFAGDRVTSVGTPKRKSAHGCLFGIDMIITLAHWSPGDMAAFHRRHVWILFPSNRIVVFWLKFNWSLISNKNAECVFKIWKMAIFRISFNMVREAKYPNETTHAYHVSYSQHGNIIAINMRENQQLRNVNISWRGTYNNLVK